MGELLPDCYFYRKLLRASFAVQLGGSLLRNLMVYAVSLWKSGDNGKYQRRCLELISFCLLHYSQLLSTFSLLYLFLPSIALSQPNLPYLLIWQFALLLPSLLLKFNGSA